MLRRYQSDARINEFLLRIENIERGALPDPRLFAYAVERNLCGVDCPVVASIYALAASNCPQL